ncbi:Wwox, partial [Symbiodinium sp. CCMP2456]
LQQVQILKLDLTDLRQVEQVAAQLERLPALHILVNNAGVATQFPHKLTQNGIETTFQANYLGHFLLTTRLLPLLQSSSPSRLVHLTSGAHRGAPVAGVPLSLEGINDKDAMGPYARYGAAKLANLIFSQEIDRRLGHLGVYSNAVHPGVVATEMLRLDNFEAMLGSFLGALAFQAAQLRNRLFAYGAQEAALNLLFCAAAPEVEVRTVHGKLIVPIATEHPPRHAQAFNEEFAIRLWEFSEKLITESLAKTKPWAVFVATCWLSAFRIKYLFPYTVDLILIGFILAWVVSVGAAVYARFRIPEPTWYTYLCFTLGLAVVTGPLCGHWIFSSLMQHYYRVGDLKVLSGVDVSNAQGDSMLDAGIVEFAKGNYLDEMRAWHFKHHVTYCVAPVVTNRTLGPVSGCNPRGTILSRI